MAKKGERMECPPKKAGIPADFIALREYQKIVLMGFRPAGPWRTKSKGKGQPKGGK